MIKSSQQLKDLIRNKARLLKTEPHILMRNFMMERFLERLALSRYQNKFILKGGMLVASMTGLDVRATMDMDVTIKGVTLSLTTVKSLLEEILAVECNDGVNFKINDVSEIMDEAEYPGIRIGLECYFEGIRTPLKIDVSTGDIITPQEIDYGFALMFEDRKISVLAYNLETILAEKLETIFYRDVTNTRMRDFYDIYLLVKIYKEKLDFTVLREALLATAAKRGTTTKFAEAGNVLVDVENSLYLQGLWKNYQRKFSYASDISWQSIMNVVRWLWEKCD